MVGKLKEIIFFLFIFSLVTNGLALLAITPVGYAPDQYDPADYEEAQAQLALHITGTIIAGIAAAVAVGVKVAASGQSMPGDKFVAYSLFAGVLTVSLIGVISTLANIANAIPEEAKAAASIFLYIFLSLLAFMITWAYIDMAHGRSDEL
jgi:energy-converting hydrogenase Eha subunit H